MCDGANVVRSKTSVLPHELVDFVFRVVSVGLCADFPMLCRQFFMFDQSEMRDAFVRCTERFQTIRIVDFFQGEALGVVENL